MKHKSVLSEKSMLTMEAQIPSLASGAVKRAYCQALTISGKVVEAVNGQLVETSSEGGQRVIRTLATPIAIAPGTKRTRVRKA